MLLTSWPNRLPFCALSYGRSWLLAPAEFGRPLSFRAVRPPICPHPDKVGQECNEQCNCLDQDEWRVVGSALRVRLDDSEAILFLRRRTALQLSSPGLWKAAELCASPRPDSAASATARDGGYRKEAEARLTFILIAFPSRELIIETLWLRPCSTIASVSDVPIRR